MLKLCWVFLLLLLLPLSCVSQTCVAKLKCHPGFVVKPNPNHTPSSNGCGNAMVKISGDFDMTTCCDIHDICYDTCFAEKEKCDSQFETCLLDFCVDQGNVSIISFFFIFSLFFILQCFLKFFFA